MKIGVSSKKGQQIMGMPFGIIFSIILIVVFIITAGFVIKHFLDLQKCSQISIFLKDLQDNVDKVWSSTSNEKSLPVDLPSSIKQVCFVNFNQSLTNQEYASVKTRYGFYSPNFFFFPPEKACEVPYYNVKHLNVSSATKQNNPYCINNDDLQKIKLIKGFYENLVRVERA